MEVRFDHMRPQQVREARQRADVAFLPLGALEWHGPQNPLGLDGVKAHAVCCRAAEILGGGAVFPPLYYGLPRDSFDVGRMPEHQDKFIDALGAEPKRYAGYAPHGGMDVQEQWIFYQRLLRSSLDTIAGFGFRSIYVGLGHYPLVHFVRPVAVAFGRATQMLGLPVTVDFGLEADLGNTPSDHAGVFETSMMMAANPASVDLDELKRQPHMVGVGAGANAVEASLEKGQMWLESCARAMAAEARWLVEHFPQQPPRHKHKR
jgi:creatinine amidohydrolase